MKKNEYLEILQNRANRVLEMYRNNKDNKEHHKLYKAYEAVLDDFKKYGINGWFPDDKNLEIRNIQVMTNIYGYEVEVDSSGKPKPCYDCGWDFDKNINEVYCAFCQSCGECCACRDPKESDNNLNKLIAPLGDYITKSDIEKFVNEEKLTENDYLEIYYKPENKNTDKTKIQKYTNTKKLDIKIQDLKNTELPKKIVQVEIEE